MDKTSGRATEEEPLFQGGQTGNFHCVYKAEQISRLHGGQSG